MTTVAAKTLSAIIFAMFGMAFTQIAVAVPDGISFQAFLTDSDGAPVNSTVSITFTAYSVDVGGVPLWSQAQSVAADQGLFTVTLGNAVNPFPAGLFNTPVYIGLFVAGEEMLPRRELQSVAYSFKAADADTLNGMQASSLDQSSDVTSLQGDIGNLDDRVTSLEFIGADITGVSAGAGLTGGGTAGDVAVGVATAGIDASMLADNSVSSAAIIDGTVGPDDIGVNAVRDIHIASGAVGSDEIADGSVTSSDIADGTVGPVDLNSSMSYTINGLTNTGATLLQGSLSIHSSSDIIVRDDSNAFRWYNDAGTTQFGAILMRSAEVSLFDSNQSRYVVNSNADGIGIGTPLNNTGYAVSMPSLAVAGQTSVGLERVSTSYQLSSTASCHAHGNLTCYYGSATVFCPVGKRVLGGGTTGDARHGGIGQSYPAGNTFWNCSASHDVANNSRTCFAICARLE